MKEVNELFPVCDADEVQVGEIICKNFDGGRVALTQLPDGDIVAFDPVCPHFKAPLWAGRVHECEVICPWHYFRFDLRTGEATRTSSMMQLRLYPVSTHEGRVFIDTSPEALTN